jgi:ribosome-associated protein YbcJ (S4-like RNA binding protein)
VVREYLYSLIFVVCGKIIEVYKMEKDTTITEVEIHTPYIQLGQLIKKIGLVESGGEVKTFLNQNPIQVNHVPEQRRGRKLYPGDHVMVLAKHITIKGI